uniref:ADP,ATP carrier protein n=1 Tax=Pyramimonas obovata TaxID=1411642 RepID=A0A7S0MXV0_9CHLO|mmetsp:Transcript_14166/g.30293  ORF Transcript_14166/g.30293 Transcript_14166/m.30293 type:complete len:357 (+) Transcript_14166:38-1108(+)
MFSVEGIRSDVLFGLYGKEDVKKHEAVATTSHTATDRNTGDASASSPCLPWMIPTPVEGGGRSTVQRFLEANKMVAAGGAAGAMARTASAPLDRIKLLFQVQAVSTSGVKSDAYTGVWQSFRKIYAEEGLLAFWKGNGTNLIRIVPYSSTQLSANDFYKRLLAGEGGELSVAARLTSGACAGMTATALTHPLDTVRLRLALPRSGYSGMTNAFVTIVRVEGAGALLKGLPATLVGIAPYAAVNFAAYDLAKNFTQSVLQLQQSWVLNLALGGGTGLFAASICYPLDTVRRRMQMKGAMYHNTLHCVTTMARSEGYRGFYKGWLANALKVVPQNSIRFVSYELLKALLGVQKQKTDT